MCQTPQDIKDTTQHLMDLDRPRWEIVDYHIDSVTEMAAAQSLTFSQALALVIACEPTGTP